MGDYSRSTGCGLRVTLLESLLDAIVRLEGDALVMHVGEKPYVVTTSSSMNAYRGPLAWGQVELSSRVLTPDAVMSMVTQILPVEQRQSLDELGAVEHEIVPPAGVADRFTVVAARGGDDIWLELRRLPLNVVEPVSGIGACGADGRRGLQRGRRRCGWRSGASGFQRAPVRTWVTSRRNQRGSEKSKSSRKSRSKSAFR